MMNLVKKYAKEIEVLSKNHGVLKLYAFGSVLTKNFNESSDVDFLVQFSNVFPSNYFDNYMNFKENLEKTLTRKVDLVEVQTLKNPILKRSIDRTKMIVYDRRENLKMVV